MSQENALIISPNDLIKKYNNGKFILKNHYVAQAWEKSYQILGDEVAKEAYGELLMVVGLPSSGKTTVGITSEYINNYDVIFDGGFLSKITRSAVIHILKGAGWDVDCLHLTTPYNVCRNRNHRNANGQGLPFEVFKNHADSYREPKNYEGFRKIIKVSTEPRRD